MSANLPDVNVAGLIEYTVENAYWEVAGTQIRLLFVEERCNQVEPLYFVRMDPDELIAICTVLITYAKEAKRVILTRKEGCTRSH